MNFAELEMYVLRAIDKLYARDSGLLLADASEWALAHRLAVYLEQIIPGWNVDCEYNRQGTGSDPKVDSKEGRRRPDIMLHHRGWLPPEHNLLVIELKKKETDADCKKVCEFTTPPSGKRRFQYQYGLTLSFIPALRIRWFENGQKR